MPDKLARVGWHAHPGTHVDAPVVEELPFVLECRLVSFDPQTGCTAGDIVNVIVSLCTPAPEKEITDVFDEMRAVK